MARNRSCDQIEVVRECPMGCVFRFTHQAAVADNVAMENGD
jgi:hypothetical protein